MRSIFNMGFSGEPWRASLNGPSLGFWGELISGVLTAAPSFYSAYQAREMAEDAREDREDAEAAAEAARVAAEAERAAAQRKLEEERKRQLQEQQAGAIAAREEILGIPKDYALYGGLGLGAVGLVALVVSLVK